MRAFSEQFQRTYDKYWKEGKVKREKGETLLWTAAMEAVYLKEGKGEGVSKESLFRLFVAAFMFAKDAQTNGISIARHRDNDPTHVEDDEGEYALNVAVNSIDEARSAANSASLMLNELMLGYKRARPSPFEIAEMLSDYSKVWESIGDAEEALEQYEKETERR